MLEYKIQDNPLFITGLVCIGIGQTLVNENLGNFTHAILSQHMDLNNDQKYQLIGRVTGRMKHWSNYQKTKVYCPSSFKDVVVSMEECVRKLPFELGEASLVDYLKPIEEKIEEEIFKREKKKMTKERNESTKTPMNDRILLKRPTYDEAYKFCRETLGYIGLQKRTGEFLEKNAPKWMDKGNLPTEEFIRKDAGGFKENCPVRMVIINTQEWALYYIRDKLDNYRNKKELPQLNHEELQALYG